MELNSPKFFPVMEVKFPLKKSTMQIFSKKENVKYLKIQQHALKTLVSEKSCNLMCLIMISSYWLAFKLLLIYFKIPMAKMYGKCTSSTGRRTGKLHKDNLIFGAL